MSLIDMDDDEVRDLVGSYLISIDQYGKVPKGSRWLLTDVENDSNNEDNLILHVEYQYYTRTFDITEIDDYFTLCTLPANFKGAVHGFKAWG